MTDHEVQVEAAIVYETASHGDGNKHTSGTPHQMVWSDLHTHPADPADSLGQRFKHALEQLERLCYAIYGARPLAYSPYKDWIHRLNPRCLWGPEQWKEVWCPDIHPNCKERWYQFAEYAARGDNFSWLAKPSVPSRSRSGDPMRQMLDTDLRTFDRAHFPLGSVSRSGNQVGYSGNDTFDPKGTGDFGGDPANIGGDGDVHIDGDDVVISWTPPAEKAAILDWARVHYNGSSLTMAEDPPGSGTWTATIPARNHDTEAKWYIEARFVPIEGDPPDPPYLKYEPGGDSAPSSAQQYRYVAFSHWSPFPYGLPELWSHCAKGTDRYEFTEDETIEPGLINLCRFILQYIGSRYNHTPRLRSQLAECCFDTRIKFRWSGSAPWPHLVGGGKDPADKNSPLHNRDEVAGASALARRSWRGADHWYAYHPIDNKGYGRGASWLPIPEILSLEHWNVVDPDQCAIYFRGEQRGMQAGDVIEAAHIEEIIEAVDYLVKYGLWTLRPIKRRKMTPDWPIWDGKYCGEWGSLPGDDNHPVGGWNYWFACCQSSGGSGPGGCEVPFEEPTDWEDCWNNEPHGVCQIGTWVRKLCDWFIWSEGGVPDESKDFGYRIECRGGSGTPMWGCCINGCIFGDGGSRDGCGCVVCHRETIYAPFEFHRECWEMSEGCNCGWAAWVCGPQKCVYGCDDRHGNTWVKTRHDHDCPYPDWRSTGNSHGNCFGDVFTCALNVDTGEHDDIGFESVHKMYFKGAAFGFVDFADGLCGFDCSLSGSGCLDDFNQNCFSDSFWPDIPGFEDHYDWEDNYICHWCCQPSYQEEPAQTFCSAWCLPQPSLQECPDCGCEHGECNCDLNGVNACMGDYVWAALDLRIDDLAPYALHVDHPHPTPPGGGGEWPLMPNLRSYDQNPGPEYEPLWTDCPCETWSSEWGPEGQWSGDGSCVHNPFDP